MVASESFGEFLREQLAPLGRVTMRRMFGKTGVFCDGLMLGMVADTMLYLRVDALNRTAFKEAESSPPLTTLRVFKEQLGELALRHLVDLVAARAGIARGAAQTRVLPELVVRGSS